MNGMPRRKKMETLKEELISARREADHQMALYRAACAKVLELEKKWAEANPPLRRPNEYIPVSEV